MLRADEHAPATPPREEKLLTVQTASAALAPASIGARVVAFIVDGILLFVCQVLIGAIVGDLTIAGSLTRAVIYAAIGFVYFGYSWTAWRASPGQRLLGLMTVNADDGSTITWNQATMRWVFLVGPSVLNTLFGGFLGALVGLAVLVYYIYLLYTAATDSRKQGFHDQQARTLVAVRTTA
jgi:uncharacterized RDD family membrane protein YckC